MSDFVLSGHIVDLILAVLVAELLTAAFWRRRGDVRARIATLGIAALPGAFLLLALRAALNGAGWAWIALWLAASFPAHLLDLWRRPHA
jgi:hypothetical protein